MFSIMDCHYKAVETNGLSPCFTSSAKTWIFLKMCHGSDTEHTELFVGLVGWLVWLVWLVGCLFVWLVCLFILTLCWQPPGLPELFILEITPATCFNLGDDITFTQDICNNMDISGQFVINPQPDLRPFLGAFPYNHRHLGWPFQSFNGTSPTGGALSPPHLRTNQWSKVTMIQHHPASCGA